MQVALLTRAGSLGQMLDCYVASVCAFWECQGPQIAVGSFLSSYDSYEGGGKASCIMLPCLGHSAEAWNLHEARVLRTGNMEVRIALPT